MFETRSVPPALREVFGETQSPFEVIAILSFSLVATGITWWCYYLPFIEQSARPVLWREIVAFIILADIYAGCLANFTSGTEHFYMSNPHRRWVFIAIHVHLLVIAWLLKAFIVEAAIVWLYTLMSSSLVNLLNGHRLQLFIAAMLLGIGIILLSALMLPTWFYLICLFFLIKVSFSFSVQHYKKITT